MPMSKPMKVPVHHLSTNRAYSLESSYQNEKIAPENLSYLFEELPIEAIWVTTHDIDGKNSQHFFHARENQKFSQYVLDYLASEQWLQTRFLPLTMCSFDMGLFWLAPPCTYICAGYSEDSSEEIYSSQVQPSVYWLIWSQKPLNNLQKYCLEQEVRCLHLKHSSLTTEKKLRSCNQELRKTLYKVDHQLRTPLSLLEMYTDLFQHSPSKESSEKHLTHMAQQVDAIRSTLDHVKKPEFSFPASTEISDIQQIFTDSYKELQLYLEQKSIQIHGDRPPLQLAVDAWKIKQVFKNLLNNAIAFSPQNGTITCQWEIFQNEVLIELSDQGPGFSSEDLSNIFTPFYSRRRNGTGLGLMIARDIIQAYRGRLWADNLPSGGAVISIVLPRK